MDRRTQLLEGCHRRNEFAPLDDGYQYYCIDHRGAYSAADLRTIADELDRLNAAWDAQVQRDNGAEHAGQVRPW